MSLASIVTAVILIPTLLYLCYIWALPKPVPGIPYNRGAASRILGDLTEGLQQASFIRWVIEQPIKHQSPITQLFLGPFSKPVLLVSDFEETENILLRRSHDFDVSGLRNDIFTGVMPNAAISKFTDDPAFKRNRELTKGLMSPNILKTVI
jgi:hypothetical protein